MPKKQMAKKSMAPQHHANTDKDHDMGAFQDLPPLTNIGSFPLSTAPTQNVVFRPPLLRNDTSFTLRDECDNGESHPERQSETRNQRQTQTQFQTQTQTPPHTHTSEIGSSSTLDDPRTAIIPCGDGFYPNKKTMEDIGNAIMARFGEGESNWKKLKPEQKRLWFEDFKKKYKWAKSDDMLICKNFEKCGSSKYRSIMQQVRKSKSQPLWMGESAYAKLSYYWRSMNFAKKSDLAKRNCNVDAGACMHTTGSKPHSIVWLEMNEKNGGVDPPMDEFFSRTHKYQKGPNVGDWESFSKLKEEIASNSAHQSEAHHKMTQHSPRCPRTCAFTLNPLEERRRVESLGLDHWAKQWRILFLSHLRNFLPLYLIIH